MLFPYTESKRAELRPADANNAPLIYDVLFRLGRPGLPMVDDFVRAFGQGLSACFLVVDRAAGQVVGVSRLHDLTPAGHLRAEVDLAAGTSDAMRTEATALTVNFAFSMWRTRKVYFHVTEADPAPFGPEAGLIQSEARLRDHVYVHGRLWDVNVLAVVRADWDELGVKLIKQIV